MAFILGAFSTKLFLRRFTRRQLMIGLTLVTEKEPESKRLALVRQVSAVDSAPDGRTAYFSSGPRSPEGE